MVPLLPDLLGRTLPTLRDGLQHCRLVNVGSLQLLLQEFLGGALVLRGLATGGGVVLLLGARAVVGFRVGLGLRQGCSVGLGRFGLVILLKADVPGWKKTKKIIRLLKKELFAHY